MKKMSAEDFRTFERRKNVLYELIMDPQYKPMKIKEIAILLQIPKEEREGLLKVLEELIKDGKIELTKRGKYKKPETVRRNGTFIAHNKGFGFIDLEGEEEDIFVPEKYVNGAMHKDFVEFTFLPAQQGKRKEGMITKILSHGIEQLVGTFQRKENFGFVVPDNTRLLKDIYIPLERSKGAVTGHKVVVEITGYGGENKKPEGRIKEILGHINDPGTDILSIVYAYELPTEFPVKVLNQAERIPEQISEADMNGRMDIREMQMVTIDGEDAKDLDDAVSLTVEKGIYHLGVHIADVTNYVKENSALDHEALGRGTSVYLVDRVIPMLPHRLSNGICSLNAGTDRLALSCFIDLDEKGNVLGHQIAETVIRVDQRMTYTSVNRILENEDAQEMKNYERFIPMFQEMGHLAALLREKRKKRGSIDFDFPETKVILDEQGHPIELRAYDRNTATRLIEEFMLLANETVAEDYFWQERPFVYRTHESPDADKIQELALLIRNFGFGIKSQKDEIHPKEIQKLLQNIEGTEYEALISRLTLRSMKQARYTSTCTGHFGLAAKYYCHFTSPIRRYPDLQIHRIIKDSLRGRLSDERMKHYEQILDEVAKQSSKMERRAEEAERETIKLKKAEYMAQFIGEEFDGVISGVTSWGMYVELENTVEGLVHITKMEDDYYFFDERNLEFIGRESCKVYKLGQRVTVKVLDVDTMLRTVDFVLIPDEDS